MVQILRKYFQRSGSKKVEKPMDKNAPRFGNQKYFKLIWQRIKFSVADGKSYH